jgi:hypothetical protein
MGDARHHPCPGQYHHQLAIASTRRFEQLSRRVDANGVLGANNVLRKEAIVTYATLMVHLELGEPNTGLLQVARRHCQGKQN